MNELVVSAVPVFRNKALQAATTKVFKIGETIRRCAFETAHIMAEVDRSECFKDDGFNSVHEWAMETFGFKKSASYTLLRVGKEYTRAVADEKGRVKAYGSNLIPENGENDFTTSQIEKMLPGGRDLAVELVESEEITPDMTCKEIEKVIKAHTAPEPEEPGTDTVPEPEEPETDTAQELEVKYILVSDAGGIMYNVPEEILVQYLLK